jgi:hypothetical protein
LFGKHSIFLLLSSRPSSIQFHKINGQLNYVNDFKTAT